MTPSDPLDEPPRTIDLVVLPGVIALVMTLLRLAGELGQWGESWFSTAASGIAPSGVSWVVGITWLPIPFGAYFGWRLAASGEGPARPARALGWALAGLAFGWLGLRLVRWLPIPFPEWLIPLWLVMAVVAALQHLGWPALFRTLLVYGLVSRIPVVIVMFLAMGGSWGTHYDYVGAPAALQMPFWPRFLWLAFFPQLVFWVGFTIVLGALAGSLAALAGASRLRIGRAGSPGRSPGSH